jgi:outer membrane receptor protein involved in Fe transport
MFMQSVVLAAAMAAAGQVRAGDPAATVQVGASALDQRRLATGAVAHVGNAELVRFGDTTLAGALARIPGVTVRGGEVRLRGLGNGYTQVLLNGEPVPKGFDLESIAPEAVERVEVLRSASVEQSTQAIAGTINIVLRKKVPRGQRDGRLGASVNQGRVGARAGFTLAAAGASLALAAEHAPSLRRNFAVVQDARGTRAPARTDLQDRDALTLTPRLAGGGVTWQGYARVARFRNARTSHETVLAGAPSQYPEIVSRFSQDAQTARSELGWSTRLADDLRLDLTTVLDYLRRRSDFNFDGTGAYTGRHEVRAGIDERAITFTGRLARGGMRAGWDLARSERAESRVEDLRDGDVRGASDEAYRVALRRQAAYIQYEGEPAPGWTVAAGVRAEEGASPIVNAVWALAPRRQLRVALARTYKAPSLASLVPRRYTVDNDNGPTDPDTQGNPALRPERSLGVDGAYEHYTGHDDLFSVSAYVRRVDGIILERIRELDGVWIRDEANAGRAHAHGVEVEWRRQFGQAGVRVDVARNWSRVEQVPGPDNRIDGQVPLTAQLELDWRAVRLPLTFHVSYAFERGAAARMSSSWTTQTGAVRKLDLAVAWQLAPRTTLRLAGTNLVPGGTSAGERYGALARRQEREFAGPRWQLVLERRLAP